MTGRNLLGALAAAAALAFASPASGAELLTNGSFETGTFSGWTTTDLANPLTPWTVATSGAGYFRSASPQDGTYDALNGFDGAGPGHITLSQTVTIPSGGTATLTWKDRVQYALFSGAAARTLEAKVVDPISNAVLATPYSLSTGPGDGTCCSIPPGHDLGWQSHSADLSAFVGKTVKVVFDETIPEEFSGPGQVEFDAISLTHTPPALPTTKEQCKHGGWRNFAGKFENQGDCVSFVSTGGKNPPAGP
jgi:hypothetical protein